MRLRRYVSFALAFAGATLLSPCPAASSATQSVLVGRNPTAVAINSVTNKIYVANFLGNTVTVIDGATNNTTTLTTGVYPTALVVNEATNKIYVANRGSNTVTVIDGVTNATINLPVGSNPISVAVNTTTNQVYVANFYDSTVSVIDGATASIHTVHLGLNLYPCAVAINQVTNKAYVVNSVSNTVSVIDGQTLAITATVPTGVAPQAVAVNSVTNQIYVSNYTQPGSVTAIDGITNSPSTIPTAPNPFALGVNPETNTVFVANDTSSGEVTEIDGASDTATTVPAGAYPVALAVNTATNTAYVANQNSNNVTIVNPTTGTSYTVAAGAHPTALALNPVTNKVYVANYLDNTVTVVDGSSYSPLRYIPMSPCRVADTRSAPGPFGGPALAGQTSRNFTLPKGGCNVPADAAAYSLNIAVVPHWSLGYLEVWPAGTSQPKVATLNSLDGRTKSNAAIVPAGVGGAISIFASMNPAFSTDVVLDINGYFVQAAGKNGLAFFPVMPCRVLDTRDPSGPLGGPFLSGKLVRTFPILQSNCNLSASAQAYSLNFTAVPRGPLSYMTAWPHGQEQPLVATLNAVTGTTTANAAIVPAGDDGEIDVFVTSDTDLVVDVNGYFAPPGSGTNPQSLYAVAPCRLIDTRQTTGAFAGVLAPPINISANGCGIPLAAQAVVFNVTAVPAAPLGYLTLWPDGENQPRVASLNAVDGAITNNMAIVPMLNGYIDVFASGSTNLVLDVFSYFAQ